MGEHYASLVWGWNTEAKKTAEPTRQQNPPAAKPTSSKTHQAAKPTSSKTDQQQNPPATKPTNGLKYPDGSTNITAWTAKVQAGRNREVTMQRNLASYFSCILWDLLWLKRRWKTLKSKLFAMQPEAAASRNYKARVYNA